MNEQLQKKVNRAIKLIQSASKVAKENGCPEIEVAYSGGKDSDVILELTKMAGVPYRAIYKNTTIDPSGTIKHAKEMGCEIRQPKYTFFELVKKNGYPSRFYRFCCKYLKEYKILDYVILGIRREESTRRRERYNEPEVCRVYSKKEKCRQYFPILDWTKEDVSEFIGERGIKCHKLYYGENGDFHPERRLGCMCCPLSSARKRLLAFKDNPRMLKLYIKNCGKWFDNQKVINPTGGVKWFGNVYEYIFFNLFFQVKFKSLEDFRNKISGNEIISNVDSKKFLEDYFNIKL